MDQAWMGGLLRRLSDFADACGLTSSGAQHSRGFFTQILLGMDHGTGENYNVSQLQSIVKCTLVSSPK